MVYGEFKDRINRNWGGERQGNFQAIPMNRLMEKIKAYSCPVSYKDLSLHVEIPTCKSGNFFHNTKGYHVFLPCAGYKTDVLLQEC